MQILFGPDGPAWLQVSARHCAMKIKGRELAGRLALSAAVLGSWFWQYGLMGADFNADNSIAADMALRPFAATSLYVWGQNRQGMALSLIAHVLHLLGLP